MAVETFQGRVREWIESCFPGGEASNQKSRTFRFIEEALELSQAAGCSEADMLALVEYVYGRPVGVVEKEVGGVLVTLSGLCSSFDVDMDKAAEDELKRNWVRLHEIREKHSGRPDDSPLPE